MPAHGPGVGQSQLSNLCLRLFFQPVRFVTFSLGDDAVAETDIGVPTLEFFHLEGSLRFLGDVESFAVTLRRQKDVIVHMGVDGLEKERLDLDQSRAIHELAAAEVLKPCFGAFHTCEQVACADRNPSFCFSRWDVSAITPVAWQAELIPIFPLLEFGCPSFTSLVLQRHALTWYPEPGILQLGGGLEARKRDLS